MYKRPALFILTILICLTLCLTLAFMPSCKKKSTEGVLNARLEGSRIVWDPYDGAVSYTVKCSLKNNSGYSINVKDTSYASPYTDPGDYVYYVYAKNAKGKTIAASEKLTFHLGTGREADAVLIGSAEDLSKLESSYTMQFEEKVSAPVYYRMTADIDLTGKDFTPIGTSAKPFLGVFDGAGHTIKGLNFTVCNTDGNIGLFGYCKNAIIKNVRIEDASILFDKDSKTGKGELNCGFVVGDAVSSIVDNCFVTGNMDILPKVITTDNYILSAGGVVGRAESSMVTCVSFEGDIKAQYGRTYAGGLIGYGFGSSPNMMLLNGKAVATVSAVGTSYNTTTNASTAQARAGVLVGNLNYTGRIASLLAIGSAEAKSTKSGTAVSSLTSGVLGRCKTENNVAMVPMYNIFYDESIPKVAGGTESLGSYAKYVYPLSQEQMKDKEHYNIGERYGLNFDKYWDLPEGGVPTLKGVSSLAEQPSLQISLRSDVSGHKFSYDFLLEDAFVPTYFDVTLESTVHGFGYNLNTLLDKMGVGIADIYSDDEIDRGVTVKISAEGKEDIVLNLTQASVHTYLEYAVYPVYEEPAGTSGGYKIISTVSSLNTYDFTDVKQITITFLPPTTEG